jgi:hypothetical protein
MGVDSHKVVSIFFDTLSCVIGFKVKNKRLYIPTLALEDISCGFTVVSGQVLGAEGLVPLICRFSGSSYPHPLHGDLSSPRRSVIFSPFSTKHLTSMNLSINNESTPTTSLSALRNTQRAPKSCRNCAARKVRCDKSIPCLRCIRRGESESCIRETVIVRGQVTIGKNDGSLMTYDELARENARLRKALADMGKTEDASRRAQRSGDNDLYYEKAFFQASAGSAREPVGLMKEEDILLPGISCSDALIRHDEAWNSWVHYALEYPRFAREHSNFMASLDKGATLQSMDPSWLAIYFAVITVRSSCPTSITSLTQVTRLHY